MDLVPSIINAAVVALVGAFITYITRVQFNDLRDEIKEVKQDVRDLRTELRTELRSEIASVRSDLTQIALAVGAQARPQTG